MGVFSKEENPWNGGQFESDFQAWEYFIVRSGLPGACLVDSLSSW